MFSIFSTQFYVFQLFVLNLTIRVNSFDSPFQVDLAPLMSSLLGSPVPRHSSGRLPLDYLALHEAHAVEAAAAVARQANEQLTVIRRRY